MAQITEVAPDLFRITTFLEPFNLQFSQFLVRDAEPLLYHTGPRALFPAVREAVASLIDLRTLRWIGFSHFEADECGSLPEWQQLAPQSDAVCSMVGKLVSVDDCLALRRAKGMTDGEVLETGKYRFRFLATPHVPHCWESGLMFEETQRTLLCSDLLHQNGNVEPVTQSDVVGRSRDVLVEYQQGPLANYMPYCTLTDPTLQRLAALHDTLRRESGRGGPLVDRWSFNRLGSSRSCCMSAAPETIRCEVLCAYVTSSLRSAWPVA